MRRLRLSGWLRCRGLVVREAQDKNILPFSPPLSRLHFRSNTALIDEYGKAYDGARFGDDDENPELMRRRGAEE
jgi:hypothetical protein